MKSIIDRPTLRVSISEDLRRGYIALLGQSGSGRQTFIKTLVHEKPFLSGMKFVSLSLPNGMGEEDDDFKEILLGRLTGAIAHAPPEETLQNEVVREVEKQRGRSADLRLRMALDALGTKTTADPLVIILHSLAGAPERPLKNLLLMLRDYDSPIMQGQPGRRLRFLAVGDLRLWMLCCSKIDVHSPFNIAKRVFLDGLSYEELLEFDRLRDPEAAMHIRSLTGGVPSLVEKVLELPEISDNLSPFFERLGEHWKALPEASQQILMRLAGGDEAFPSCNVDDQCRQIPEVDSPWRDAFWKGFLSVQDSTLTWRSLIHHAFVLSRIQGRRDISKSTLIKVDLRERAERLQKVLKHAQNTELLINAPRWKTRRSQEDFDVFLCHNGEDKLLVKEIANQLLAHGILPWLDEWELRPGLPWQPVLEQQLGQIKAAAVFIGNKGLGSWQREELDVLLGEDHRRGCIVIPVILPNAPQETEAQKEKGIGIPAFLKNRTWVNFRVSDPNPISQLIWGITGTRDFAR